MDDEIPLSGGNVATDVVRIGETIRKPPTPFDAAVTALLDQLEDAGVDGVPRARGVDEKGRRILTWLPGATSMPETVWSTLVTLESAARLLRKIHDASVPLLNANHHWAISTPGPSDDMVIGHSDFAPYNMVFSDAGTVTGVYDFDLAGPAPRLRDLAYLAWWMVPFGEQDPKMAAATRADVRNGSARLQALCEAYGVPADKALLTMVAQVLDHMGDAEATATMIGREAAAKLQVGGHFAHWQRAADDFARLSVQIAANLGSSPGSR